MIEVQDHLLQAENAIAARIVGDFHNGYRRVRGVARAVQ